jgi:hypothetical protein
MLDMSLAYSGNAWFRSLNIPGAEDGIVYVVTMQMINSVNKKLFNSISLFLT